MSAKAYECKVCKSKELYKGAFCKPCHRDYQTNSMRASRSAKKAMAARANANRPNMTIAPPAPASAPYHPKRGRPKAIACKVCGGKPEIGAFCRPCRYKAEAKWRHGEGHEYRAAAAKLDIGDTCPKCGKEVRAKHRKYAYMCLPCGRKKTAGDQRRRRAQAKRPANNPIVVEPKNHRAKGQSMAPPAPRIEGKPEPMIGPIPRGMTGRLPSACPDLRAYCAEDTIPYARAWRH